MINGFLFSDPGHFEWLRISCDGNEIHTMTKANPVQARSFHRIVKGSRMAGYLGNDRQIERGNVTPAADRRVKIFREERQRNPYDQSDGNAKQRLQPGRQWCRDGSHVHGVEWYHLRTLKSQLRKVHLILILQHVNCRRRDLLEFVGIRPVTDIQRHDAARAVGLNRALQRIYIIRFVGSVELVRDLLSKRLGFHPTSKVVHCVLGAKPGDVALVLKSFGGIRAWYLTCREPDRYGVTRRRRQNLPERWDRQHQRHQSRQGDQPPAADDNGPQLFQFQVFSPVRKGYRMSSPQ